MCSDVRDVPAALTGLRQGAYHARQVLRRSCITGCITKESVIMRRLIFGLAMVLMAGLAALTILRAGADSEAGRVERFTRGSGTGSDRMRDEITIRQRMDVNRALADENVIPDA